MGMAISFIFMWVTSILEMWLFKPIFINGIGSRYLEWRDSPEASIPDRLLALIKVLIAEIKPTSQFILKQWLTHVWPVIKSKLKK